MGDRLRAVVFRWREVDVVLDGGQIVSMKAMVPEPRFKTLCERQFAGDETYALGPVEGVSSGSRGHFFASVKDAWSSLPEEDMRFPGPEHLRKRALVQAGWAAHAQYVMDTPKDATNMARGLRRADEYAVIKVSANVVDVWTAKSIAAGQISGDEFKEIKTKALDWIAALTGATRTELERHSKDGGAR